MEKLDIYSFLTLIFLGSINCNMEDFIDKLNKTVSKETVSFEPILINVESLINTIKQDMIIAFQSKQNTFSAVSRRDEKESEFYESFYIISRNRIDALKSVLNYLLLSAKKYIELPSNKRNEINDNLISSINEYYRDFLKNAHFLVDLLLETDVNDVIIKNYKIAYPNSNKNDIIKYIKENYKKFKNILPAAKNKNAKNYNEIINALISLSLFWFKVKGEKEENIRRSDKYIYQLCRIFLF